MSSVTQTFNYQLPEPLTKVYEAINTVAEQYSGGVTLPNVKVTVNNSAYSVWNINLNFEGGQHQYEE